MGPCEDMLEASIRLEKYLKVLDSGMLPDDSDMAQVAWTRQTG